MKKVHIFLFHEGEVLFLGEVDPFSQHIVVDCLECAGLLGLEEVGWVPFWYAL